MIITDENFNEVITNNEFVVLDFGANWCSPCRALKPIIELLISSNPDTPIGKIDIDENPILSSKYSIRSIPAVLYIKNGEVVDKHGFSTLTNMQNKINALK